MIKGMRRQDPYLIFITNSTNISVEKNWHVEKFQISMHNRCGDIWNFYMWSNFNFLHMQDVEKSKISPHVEWIDVEKSDISFHLAFVWCGKVSTYAQFLLFCCEISFVVIYALLSQNLFCHYLRTSLVGTKSQHFPFFLRLP